MDCRQCGEVIEAGFSFCEACGTAIGGAYATPQLKQEQQAQLGLSCLCGNADFDADAICENCGRKQQVVDYPELQILNHATASATHRGMHHAENQDAVAICDVNGVLALAVADGVSTACRAKEAATVAVTIALAILQEHAALLPDQRLQLAVSKANEAICAMPYDDTILAEPEATLVVALVDKGQLHYAWVGDSRLYVVTADTVLQLTEDDSWLNQQLKAGVSITAANKDKNAHCITQCLGMRDDVPEIHIGSMQLNSDANVLLCTDGLWNYCDNQAAMLARFNSTLSVKEQSLSLIDYANQQGGHDNISVVLHRYCLPI